MPYSCPIHLLLNKRLLSSGHPSLCWPLFFQYIYLFIFCGKAQEWGLALKGIDCWGGLSRNAWMHTSLLPSRFLFCSVEISAQGQFMLRTGHLSLFSLSLQTLSELSFCSHLPLMFLSLCLTSSHSLSSSSLVTAQSRPINYPINQFTFSNPIVHRRR